MTSTADTTLSPILERCPVIPVIAIDELSDAVPLAQALVDGGLTVLEITLRTRVALDAMKAVIDQVPQAVVGVGTVLTSDQFDAAERAGARFAVSPGATERLLDATAGRGVSLLPGAATASEVMVLRERGFRLLKFFPAEPSGGARFLGSLAPVIPDVRFCPTGGITPGNAGDYLKLPNVVCVGGSWMVPRDRIAARDWAGIRDLAATAAALERPPR
ncbi:MAG: bifunctional 4-hydroxy-2-oxoglutarate aldolase/2-dehydro-3-deoxy-phosphogluconate aldolase [Betaproteobacteria bacterium]|nr:bifunctional 4-hydroxy-2-oxoglutarate aldolase/2-dehydro-3-deoxy-phosphogluconate aldolase [Betaproteobacteria bacterium]